MPELNVKFSHGLGDVAHFILALQLWKARGYDITVQIERNKQPLWDMAGVKYVFDGDLPDHPWTYPSSFEDLSVPDWRGNKIAEGLMHPVMPEIGSQKELWEELLRVKVSSNGLISEQSQIEATEFLKGLPRPIICLHTKGTNWQERKSLDTTVAFELILQLLSATDGSVISLDFDAREPIVGHPRCKGIMPSWGEIDQNKMCALYQMSDLMIGIDSGPFHVASFTDIKALGVFTEIHPVRCCIPNPNAMYLVSDRFNEYWDQRANAWRFWKYRGDRPSASEICEAAIQALNGHYSVRQLPQDIVAKYAGAYTYDRVGYDRRKMELLPGGTIGLGAAGCELRWTVQDIDGAITMTIHGAQYPTCNLVCDDSGSWRGRWLRHEKMPIELKPWSKDESSISVT